MKLIRIQTVITAAMILALVPACNQRPAKQKVAFITNNAYDWWKIAQRGTEKAAVEFDIDVEFKMPSGGGSSEEQRRIIEDLLAKGVQGIAISPNDAANQTEFFKEIGARIPVITQDSDLPDIKARRCYIGTDNYKAGRAAGELVKKAVPGGGKIVIFVGKLDVQNAIERRQGVLDELAGKPKGQGEPAISNHKYGDYLLLDTRTDDGSREKCRANADDILVKNPDVACLVGLWEYNPPAMFQAVLNAKKQGNVGIVGFDENEEILEGIKQGYVAGTVVQNPFQFGYEAVKILAGLVRLDPATFERPDIDKEHRLFVPHRVITKENVDAFGEELKKLKG